MAQAGFQPPIKSPQITTQTPYNLAKQFLKPKYREAMNKEEVKIMQDKIVKGVELAYSRLMIQKQKDNSELVFSRNGKIVNVKARNLTIENKDTGEMK